MPELFLGGVGGTGENGCFNMMKVLTKPIPCRVWLVVTLALLACTLFALVASMVRYDALSGRTRAAIYELAAKGKSDPAEVARLLQEAADTLNKGERLDAAVHGMLDISRGIVAP